MLNSSNLMSADECGQRKVLGDMWQWFGRAALSGLLLRLAGAAFNLLAIPIAILSLGNEKFAASGALLGLAAWLTVGSGGLGNATAMLVVHKKNDRQLRELIWQGAIPCFASTFVICIICALLVPTFASHVLPQAKPEIVNDFRIAGYCCFVALALNAVATPFEGVYVGLLKTSYCNVVRFGFQLVAIAAIVTVGKYTTHITVISLLLILGPTTASIWFLAKGIRDYPLPDGFRFTWRKSLPILTQGYGFLASSLSGLFICGGSLPLFAITFGPGEVSTATVVARIMQVYSGMLFIVLSPVSIVLRQAHTTASASHARQALAFGGVAIACGSVAVAGGILLFGKPAIAWWVGVPLVALDSWLIPLATMVFALSWCATWSYIAQAMRGSILGAKLAITEIVLASLFYFVLGKHLAPSSSLYVLAATMLACSGTLLPLLITRDLAAVLKGDKVNLQPM